jgi:Domain of unknown function (DUF3597)
MSLFNNLMSKIFGHASSSASAPTAAPSAGQPAAPSASQSAAQPGQPAQTSAPSPAPGGTGATASSAPVDVAAILDGLAAKNPEKLDWKHSIVDLMKLVGMDSSFSARKQLAAELNYTGDPNDSASMNTWLHKEVLKKLAANGGKVPQELLR